MRKRADTLLTPGQVSVALDRMAQEMTVQLADDDPLLLCVLKGGIVATAWLATRLDFALEIGYLHVTRYRGATRGSNVEWRTVLSHSVEHRTVVVIDDILDEGHTLLTIINELHRLGARRVLSAVLADKIHDRKAPGLNVDFVGFHVEDRYLFGCGMDYKEYWRNLPGIYAVSREDDAGH